METVRFCQRNTKFWAALLAVSGAVVLGYSLWLVFERGQFSGFGSLEGARGGSSIQGAQNYDVGGSGSGVQAASPVGMAVGGTVYSIQSPSSNQYTTTALGTTQTTPEAMTAATPGGGFALVGGNRQGSSQAYALQTAFNSAADVIRPSVVKVSIDASSLSDTRTGQRAGSREPRFANPFDGIPDFVIDQRPYESVGTGLIIDQAGYVVTNHHVVAGTQFVVISRFHRSEEHLPATVVSIDVANDLALLKINAESTFTPATLADSDQVEVGDWVLAVGNPFGLEHTVTAGIVGARGTELMLGGVNYQGLLQTDAPINKGSSGGPLVNIAGQVVGINTAIYAPTGVFNGTGFAISSNAVRRFLGAVFTGATTTVSNAESGAAVNRGSVGVGVSDMTQALARKLSYSYTGGVFVNTVLANSVAEQAKIRRGDVIITMQGQPVSNTSGLEQLARTTPLGRSVEFIVWRDGKERTLTARP